MEELKKNRWTFSEKYTCKKQFECLRREELIEVMMNDSLTEFQYVIENGEWIVVKK